MLSSITFVQFPLVYFLLLIGFKTFKIFSITFSSVAQLYPTLCNPMDCSTPGLPVHHQLLELTQTHVHRVCDAIQPSHPLSSPSSPAPNPSQQQGLFFAWGRKCSAEAESKLCHYRYICRSKLWSVIFDVNCYSSLKSLMMVSSFLAIKHFLKLRYTLLT